MNNEIIKLVNALSNDVKREEILSLIELKQKLKDITVDEIVKIDKDNKKEMTNTVKSIMIRSMGLHGKMLEDIINQKIIDIIYEEGKR